MTATISAFNWVPDFAQGHVKDLRVRWAMEEAGLAYDQRLVDGDIANSAEYRGWQPFGQVPAYRDESVSLFESGSIVLYLAERSEALAPRDPQGRARVTTWVLAALNSVEPAVQGVASADIFYAGEPWAPAYRERIARLLHLRLTSLSRWLEGRDFLEDRFTAGDLIMTTVLRDVPDADLEQHPVLVDYRARCTARPAFARALRAQLDAFEERDAA